MTSSVTVGHQNNTVILTKDYKKFTRVKGNRKVYPEHVKQLVEAFKDKPDALEYNPILVNDKMQIIDGQHRLEAAKKLDMPVYYIIHKNLGLVDIQDLNSGTKVWGPMDYALSYKELGKLDYKLYIEFVERYPFNHDILRHVLSQGKTSLQMFKSGKFQIFKVQKAFDIFDKLMEFQPYYKKFNERKFFMAFLKVYNNSEYHHEHMINQLQKNPNSTHTQLDMTDYLRELESIYNSGAGDLNQVRFF